MQEIILFILSFLFILVIYEIFIVAKAKKNEKSRKDKKLPIEIVFLMTKYNFNLKKIDYYKLLHVCAFVSSFDMALIVTLAMLFENTLLQLLCVVVLVVPVILISYHMVYLVYKKRGLI